MAKQIIWSLQAQDDRKQILSYWNNRNQSTTYSKKLHQLFKEALTLVSQFSQIGRQTDEENVRIKLVKDYLIVYEDSSENIYVLKIWDGRRNPEKFNKLK